MEIKTTSSIQINTEDGTILVRKSEDDDTVELKDDTGDVIEMSPQMARAVGTALVKVADEIDALTQKP